MQSVVIIQRLGLAIAMQQYQISTTIHDILVLVILYNIRRVFIHYKVTCIVFIDIIINALNIKY